MQYPQYPPAAAMASSPAGQQRMARGVAPPQQMMMTQRGQMDNGMEQQQMMPDDMMMPPVAGGVNGKKHVLPFSIDNVIDGAVERYNKIDPEKKAAYKQKGMGIAKKLGTKAFAAASAAAKAWEWEMKSIFDLPEVWILLVGWSCSIFPFVLSRQSSGWSLCYSCCPWLFRY
jgi:hypothetical protein